MTFAFQIDLPQTKLFYSTAFYTLFFSSLLILFSFNSYAKTEIDNHAESYNIGGNNFSLQPLIQLPLAPNNKNSWQQLIAHPVNSHHYYARNEQGQIYQIEQKTKGNIKTKAQLLIDFKELTLKDNAVKTLNTFTLHPNFSLKDEQGFATFYTAHTEAANKTSQTKRIQERNAMLSVSFDGVITEWQLDFTDPNQITVNSSREVLRITLPNANHGIKQLGFNPNSKSWDDNFALLYIAIDSTEFLSQFPLYSGAILRINPKKFGMEDFTVPETNPFFNNDSINNSFYLVGAQHIKQFLWSDKNRDQLLISHQYQSNNKSVNNNQSYQLLSFSQGGEDWRQDSPEQMIYKSRKQISKNQMLLYLGRNSPALHNKLLIVQKQNNLWQLSSLDQTQQISQSNKGLPQSEWPLNQVFPGSSTLQIHSNNQGELLFFQQDTGATFELFQNNIQFTDADKDTSNTFVYLFFVILFTGITCFGLYQVKVNNHSARSLVRRHYAHITLDSDHQRLNLFKRHQKTVEKYIALQDIHQCQILLGDSVIVTIDNSDKHGFNDQQEQEIREIFNREKTEKMIDGKIRRITFSITDIKKQSYITCLYLRKGNDRITKKSYYQVIDDLIDWCWLIAKTINANNTGDRNPKSKVSAAEKSQAEHILHNETPLHKQAAIIRPATHQLESQSAQSTVSEHLSEEKVNSDQTKSTGLVDTELVHALEKLVKLKQQGFLSTEEFSQAKAKLLKDLIA